MHEHRHEQERLSVAMCRMHEHRHEQERLSAGMAQETGTETGTETVPVSVPASAPVPETLDFTDKWRKRVALFQVPNNT